ncbi:hypothetical protein BDV93DRAFT_524984 [Ceratobasidium sp. AG-I]|nr:hypothetical protein BDV93DRAFT_524984 [Ceratobasidium sp. AG-I]
MNESRETNPEIYTIVIRDRTFLLFRSQIEHDSPNFFTSYFLNPSNQGCSKITKLHIFRDPDVFELVLRYLNGYHVVPIYNRFVPAESTPEIALSDLRADAEFYQLRGLIDLCVAPDQEQNLAPGLPYAMITGRLAISDAGSPAQDLLTAISGFSMSLLSEEMYTEEMKGMFSVNDEALHDPKYLPISSWINHLVRVVLLKHSPASLWQVIGWKANLKSGTRHWTIFAKLHCLPGIPLK